MLKFHCFYLLFNIPRHQQKEKGKMDKFIYPALEKGIKHDYQLSNC